MSIVQDAFYIPDDIAVGLATGQYRRIGSVVRYAVGPNKGQIVKHLKPIDLNVNEQAKGLGTKVLEFLQRHKSGVKITVAGAAALGMGTWGYKIWKSHEPKVLADFRATLKAYIDAIRTGNMDIDKINNLMNALERIKKYKNYDRISIQLTAEDLETLVSHIYDYTIKLAEDNKVELSDDELNLNSSAIINLLSYLKTQKRIFGSVA